LAGAAQLIRIERRVNTVRKGRVSKTTTQVVYAVSSRWSDQITPDQLLALARDHWTIENRQHHRRDRTQDEDRCLVRKTRSARNLSLFRTLVIYLFERQRPRSGACCSLPDFQRRCCRQPGRVIARFRYGLSAPSS
jgi:predicted transposase YbfD/YdcC